MSQNILFNGVVYAIPDVGDDFSTLGNFLRAIPQGALQKSGGVYSLSADVNFGSNFGLLSKYYKTISSLPATTGILRLSLADTISWRNNANSGDVSLGINGSDQITWNGSALTVSGLTGLTGDVIATGPGSVNAAFRQATALSILGNATNATAAMADIAAGGNFYVLFRNGTTLTFALLTNNNIDPAAAIAYTKLALTGSIVNADIAGTAQIAYAKLANLASNNFLGRITGGTGAIEVLSTTQATSMLTAMVGDSGSGGTKGLVPAPGAGDAAALKFLKANGTWAVPPSAGALSVVAKTTNYNASTSDDVILCSNSITITLPAATNIGKLIRVINIGTGIVTVAASGFDDILYQPLSVTTSITLNDQYESLTLVDGQSSLWYVVSEKRIGVIGTTVNIDADAGYVGEFISANPASPVAVGSSTAYVNITAITLTAGDWDVTANVCLHTTATTSSLQFINMGITSTSGAMDSATSGGYSALAYASVAGGIIDNAFPISTRRFLLSSTTTIYLIGAIIYSASGGATWGTQSYIRARRIR